MTRRAALVWLFLAGGAVFVPLALLDAKLWDEGGPGIVGFELAFTERHAERIREEWEADGRRAARWSLIVDFLYMALYTAFWVLATRAAGAARLWMIAVAAGVCDFIENVLLLFVLGGTGGTAPALAAFFAGLKFACLTIVIAYVAVVLIRRFPRIAAAGALAVVIFLAVNTVLVERATEPAQRDIGRILELPGGDIQVREDGPRDGPPVVLVHGFGASMRWFDGVVQPLAREFRVVRIDLLGHGGSEKPRDGYSMQNQADIVAQVMDALGVRRAPFVGHSMGGIVGTALVERHPERVSHLMMIGTPPDAEDLEGGLLASAPFWPVIGHASDTLTSTRIVRWAVEGGFAPEFDPPERLSEDIFGRTTWSAFHDSSAAIGDYWDEAPLDERLADESVPVTVVLGEEERHTRRSLGLYNRIPGARTVEMAGLDHSPQVESPARTAPLIAAVVRGR